MTSCVVKSRLTGGSLCSRPERVPRIVFDITLHYNFQNLYYFEN